MKRLFTKSEVIEIANKRRKLYILKGAIRGIVFFLLLSWTFSIFIDFDLVNLEFYKLLILCLLPFELLFFVLNKKKLDKDM